MTADLGFDQPLYVLPFDHRGTFLAKMPARRARPTPSTQR